MKWAWMLFAAATVWYLANVVEFYVAEPWMLGPLTVVFASWSMSAVDMRYVLTRDPLDERVRALLYGITLLAVWCVTPLVGFVVGSATGVLGHFVVTAALRRHMAGLPIMPPQLLRRRRWVRIDIQPALARHSRLAATQHGGWPFAG